MSGCGDLDWMLERCGLDCWTTPVGRGLRRLICGLSRDCCLGGLTTELDVGLAVVAKTRGAATGFLGLMATCGVSTDLAITLVGSMMNTLPLRIITLFGLIRPVGR